MKMIAKTLFGLEEVLAGELAALGAGRIEILTRAVSFEGNRRLLYRCNYSLRTALRVLVPLFQFRAANEKQLYRRIYRFDWTPYLDQRTTFAVDSSTSGTFFTHSHYAGLVVKDAIVDQLRKKTGARPNVQLRQPDLLINLHIQRDVVNVSLDSSGESLHKRGYRMVNTEAPISEVLAAGIIQLSGWRGERDLLDPMCGSGTFLTEGAMLAANIPPQRQRNFFGFTRWKKYDSELWSDVRQQADAAVRTFEGKVRGVDSDFKAVRATEENALAAGVADLITVERKRFEKLDAPENPLTLITNPPYDVRLKSDSLPDLYQLIGDELKHKYSGSEAWIISSNREAIKQIGLRPSLRKMVFNGALECRLLKFEMYAGSKKNK